MGPMEGVVVLGVLGIILWFLSEVLHKAGYSRWWCLLGPIPLLGFIGLYHFARADWPVLRELSWRRLAAGTGTEQDFKRTQDYAVKLESDGDWQRAIEVHETVARLARDKQDSEYATACILRLKGRMRGQYLSELINS